MNSIVCISQVPDTEAKIKIAAGGKTIDETGVKFIVSPYDEFALEEAIRLKESKGGDVTVLTYGPERAAQALRECLARGATKAVHIKGSLEEIDSLGIARVLAAAIKAQPFDVVFLGKMGVGTDNALVGPMLAELLDLPQLNVVTKVEFGEGTVKGHREIEGGEEVIEAPLPALITAQKGLNEPRYASLKGIMAAKKIAIETRSVADLGIGEADGRGGIVIESLEMPPEKAAGRKIEATDPAAAAKEIVQYIQSEAKAF
ncbi:MAG: electron transfer flavoprotein subunit beta/FixA family protein [Acidobacteria bacterium]|nr:electron transfer flavoprotein subunit beta/FixA family protein [Acidobacteriota bacterium]